MQIKIKDPHQPKKSIKESGLASDDKGWTYFVLNQSNIRNLMKNGDSYKDRVLVVRLETGIIYDFGPHQLQPLEPIGEWECTKVT